MIVGVCTPQERHIIMKNETEDIRILGIENGCVVSVKASNAEKMKNWKKLSSPSDKEDSRNNKRGDNLHR